MAQNTLKRAHQDWIGSEDFNVFITATLSQGLPDDTFRGVIRLIDRYNLVRTACFFRDRLHRNLLGKGVKLPFAAFAEGGAEKRHHLHFLALRPDDCDIVAYHDAVHKVAAGLPWMRQRIDIRPLTYGSPSRVTGYCLKEGLDAFIPEASWLPGSI